MPPEPVKGRLYLEVVAGPHAGERFPLAEDTTFLVGRATQCDGCLRRDVGLSREHFLLEIHDGVVMLNDLGSLNGTCINGVVHGLRSLAGAGAGKPPRPTPVTLQTGDRLAAGESQLMLRCEPEQPSPSGHGPHGTAILPGEPTQKFDSLVRRFLDEPLPKKPLPCIPGYTEISFLDSGGFGEVYRARRSADQRLVALKKLVPTKGDKLRRLMFKRESYLVEQLSHPNIVASRSVRVLRGLLRRELLIEMEYMAGGSVQNWLDRHSGPLAFAQAAPIMLDVLHALAYAHHVELTAHTAEGRRQVHGIVHRDMKPANILLTEHADRPVAKIADFGLAKSFLTAGLTVGKITASLQGTCRGSLLCMAREHLHNFRYVQPVTDVFETAATFYYMLTRQPVWRFAPDCNYAKVIENGDLRDVNSDLQGRAEPPFIQVLLTALAIDPTQRYPTAREFKEAVEDAL